MDRDTQEYLRLRVKVDSEVQTFLAHMVNTHTMSADDVVYFLEKPWQWAEEFDEWAKSAND